MSFADWWQKVGLTAGAKSRALLGALQRFLYGHKVTYSFCARTCPFKQGMPQAVPVSKNAAGLINPMSCS